MIPTMVDKVIDNMDDKGQGANYCYSVDDDTSLRRCERWCYKTMKKDMQDM